MSDGPFGAGPQRRIFVFGSNLAGRHGKGAALEAVQKHGAIRGVGEGLQGDSYAIPTKDHQLRTLPLDVIERGVTIFCNRVRQELPDSTALHWYITAIGCGLAGYTPEDIAPMFRQLTQFPAYAHHYTLPITFVEVLGRTQTFRTRRRALRLTQAELATELGMSTRAVQALESGDAPVRRIHNFALNWLEHTRKTTP